MPIPAEAIDLLICCASVDPEKGPKLESLISKGVDWNLVIEQGNRHDVLPLLYWSLKTRFWNVKTEQSKTFRGPTPCNRD